MSRPPRLSAVEKTEIVLPSDANALGTAFGGRIISWVDIAGGIAAQRHCRRVVVTASMDDIHFVAPIEQGEVVVLLAQVNAAWHSSMEVGVRVLAENPLTGERKHAATAYLTFVARDEKGRTVPVPPLVPETADEWRRQEEAGERRAHRLERRALRATRV